VVTVNLGVTAAAIAVLMVLALVVAVWLRGGRHDGIDAVWGAGFALTALITVVLSSGHGDPWRRCLVTVLTLIWGALIWLVSLRVQLAQYGRGDTLLDGTEVATWLGVLCWLVGFGFGFETTHPRQRRPPTGSHHQRRRPGYANYITRTSGYLPLPPRQPPGRRDRSALSAHPNGHPPNTS
jgi:steroid 5-alpha reductase family enzyme